MDVAWIGLMLIVSGCATGGGTENRAGVTALRQGAWTKAVYFFRRIIEHRRTCTLRGRTTPSLCVMDGQTAEADREWAEFERRSRDAVNPDLPSNYEWVEALALADETWGRGAEAVAWYRHVIELNPASGWAHRRLALLQSDPDAALELARKAAALMPADRRATRLVERLVAARQ